jgi:hypothetical protein
MTYANDDRPPVPGIQPGFTIIAHLADGTIGTVTLSLNLSANDRMVTFLRVAIEAAIQQPRTPDHFIKGYIA